MGGAKQERKTAYNKPCRNCQKLQQRIEGLEEMVEHEHEYSCKEYVNKLGGMKKENANLKEKIRKLEPEILRKARVSVSQRLPEMRQVVKYNLLERKKEKDNMIMNWISYPGLAPIISEARNIVETGQITNIEKLIESMKSHENQPSAPIVTSIAVLIGCNDAIGKKLANHAARP